MSGVGGECGELEDRLLDMAQAQVDLRKRKACTLAEKKRIRGKEEFGRKLMERATSSKRARDSGESNDANEKRRANETSTSPLERWVAWRHLSRCQNASELVSRASV